jgi:two-component system cell cycle sensor histidine kinase PleC
MTIQLPNASILSEILDTLPGGILLLDASRRVLYLNRTMARWCAVDRHAALGRQLADILPAGSAPKKLADAIDGALAGTPITIHLTFPLAGEVWRRVSVDCAPQHGGDGHVWGCCLSINALTQSEEIGTPHEAEQQEIRDTLRRKEQLTQEVARLSHIGIFDHDHESDVIFWSPEQRRIFGWDMIEPVTIEKLVAQIHPQDRARVDAALKRAHDPAGDGRFDIEYRILHRDGTVRWLDNRSQTYFAGTGAASRPFRTIGAVIDVSARRLAEEALWGHENLLRQGAEIGRFGTWMWDVTDDRCLVCSEELAALFGMSVAEFERERNSDRKIRHDPLPSYRPEDDERGLTEAGRRYEEEFRALTKGGELRWFREIGHVYRNAETGRLWAVGVTQDVTDTKNSEAELRRLIEESGRLAQLAEQSNRAKSEFLATMSHELRTPLNAIIGFSELLMTFGNNMAMDKQGEYHGIILQSGRHLLSLINDILDLAKVESGRLELRPVDVPLQVVAQECVGYLEPAARPKSLSIELDIPPIELRSDRRLLKQLLLNILSNAVKFNREGGRINLSAAHHDDGEHLVIAIADTGIGMSGPEIERALQPFAQVERAHSRTIEGTGLGLTLVQRFTAILGGEFSVASEPEVGTTVTLKLPLKQEVQPA